LSQSFQVNPIGYIRAGAEGFCLKINEDYRPALKELENFSHINVLYWFNHSDSAADRAVTQEEKPYRNAPEVVGVFATRSPRRPNPVALSVTEILSVDIENGVIIIPYIDALDGSPIIDVKPYHPSLDRVREVKVAEWCSHWPEWYEDSVFFDWESVFVDGE